MIRTLLSGMALRRRTLRLIHHLSSSGGTVISKCLAAMPDTVLLSEVHPLVASRTVFFPIDPFGQMMWNYPQLAPDEGRLYELFRQRLDPVYRQCALHRKTLVLRDHAHSDYLSPRTTAGHLVKALAPRYELLRAATIRDPIDAWLSMLASQFTAELSGFQDYCRRVLRFLDDHAQVGIWRYEDFVADPPKVVAAICGHLALPYDPTFLERYGQIVLTGDSGRKPATIRPLSRREAPEGFLETAIALPEYRTIAERFDYQR